ncbi:hypothetical protein [Spirosoma areae]
MEKVTLHQLKYGLLLILLGGLWACKGPQGDVGPQGAIGPAGPQGVQGVQGAANMLVSPWKMIAAADWKSDNDPLYFYTSFEDNNLTQAVLDKGLVMAYYRSPGQKSVVLSLPSVTEKLSIGYFFLVNQGKGVMNFDLSYFLPRNVPIDFDIDVRWIIIPPNPGGRLGAVDWTNYEDVKRKLSLPE